LRPIATAPLLPLSTKLLMVRELFIRATGDSERGKEDESVAQFVRRHFGRPMLENIVDPLLSGVYGGDSEFLSMRSVLPRFCTMEKGQGSLIRAILRARARAPRASSSRPIFTTLRSGLSEMIARLTPPAQPGESPTESRVWLQTPVAKVESKAAGHAGIGQAPRYTIRFDDGRSLEAHAIILALPGYECSRLLTPLDGALGAALGEISCSSALTVALAFDEAVQIPPGFGFLVPKKEGRRMLACTFVHQKFNHRAPPGKALLRCFFGGAGNERVLEMDDREVVSLAQKELKEILGLRAEPLFHRVYRWPRAMPQYNVGHEKRLAAIQESKKNLPGIFLAGNSYSGIGISDCIRTGKAAAQEAIQYLSATR
ncbi:MAG: protoporphyrinogen oxidase, partial [Terriglobia bacterium]